MACEFCGLASHTTLSHRRIQESETAMNEEAKERFQKSWEAQRRVAAESGLNRFDMMRHFPVYVPTFHLARFVAHYEVFKNTLSIPGDIVELGVYHGSSLLTWLWIATYSS